MESLDTKTFKGIIIKEYGKLEISDLPFTKIPPNTVLIKVAYAPVNPSDLMGIRGDHSLGGPLPAHVGFEGSGTIESVGEDLNCPYKIGDKVAFFTLTTGSWKQYVLVPTEQVFSLNEDTSLLEACSFFINPVTICLWVHKLKSENVEIFVHTAGAGSLGKMLIKYCKVVGIKIINLVRSDKNVEILEKAGSDYTFNILSDSFETEFKNLVEKLNVKACLEAIGGDFVGKITKLMPNQSTIYVYGDLAGWDAKIDLKEMLFNHKVIRTIDNPHFIFSLEPEIKNEIIANVRNNLKTIFHSEHQVFEFENYLEAVDFSINKGSIAKSVLKFSN